MVGRTTLLTVALLALAASDSVTLGAKCYPKTRPEATPAPELVEEITPTSFGGSETNDSPTQTATDAPATETGSFGAPTAQSGSYEAPATETGSFGAPTAQSGSYEAPATETGSNGGTEDSSATTQGSLESNDVSQGSATQTQGSSDVSTGNSTSTATGEHATFGKQSSNGKCVTGDPDAGDVTREMVDWVWKNTMEEYIPQFKNLIFDQLITNKGKLSYCVRWDNDQKLEKATASKFQAVLEKQINLWNRWLVGYECWPIEKIEVSIVAYAVKDKSIMDWTDDSLGMIYEGIVDAEGSPKCPDECYKHQGQAASADTSGCKGKPFDMSFWPSTKPGEGAIGTGGDWGQRVEVNDMLNTMDGEEMMVLLHEMGHGFGLPEMYVDKNKPAGYPACVMDNSLTLTDGDGWLLRSVLEHVKDRYNF